jgi:(1->4)-alpha-D-glucan 1-alpha-D-glucosylmutase
MLKAVKEAKSRTSWVNPDQDYEDALASFIESIIDTRDSKEFLDSFLRLQKKIAYYGALNSLSQVLIKITSPGVPDFYQGTELWDFSLVDPDNRRPIDFKKRIEMLDELLKWESLDRSSLIKQIIDSWEDGRIKLYLIYKALNTRKTYRDVFQHGQYVPLKITGMKQEHICTFTRYKGEKWTLSVAPRFFTGLSGVGETPYGNKVWRKSRLALPAGAPREWENVFTGEKISVISGKPELLLADVFRSFPLTLLINI